MGGQRKATRLSTQILPRLSKSFEENQGSNFERNRCKSPTIEASRKVRMWFNALYLTFVYSVFCPNNFILKQGSCVRFHLNQVNGRTLVTSLQKRKRAKFFGMQSKLENHSARTGRNLFRRLARFLSNRKESAPLRKWRTLLNSEHSECFQNYQYHNGRTMVLCLWHTEAAIMSTLLLIHRCLGHSIHMDVCRLVIQGIPPRMCQFIQLLCFRINIP